MRTEFTRKTKFAAFMRAGGFCEGCGARLQPGRYTYDHRVADYLGGDNSLDNCQILGWCCDKPKTAHDQTIIAKTKRIRDKRIKALTSRRPMPFGKGDWRKKKLDGTVVNRRTGRAI